MQEMEASSHSGQVWQETAGRRRCCPLIQGWGRGEGEGGGAQWVGEGGGLRLPWTHRHREGVRGEIRKAGALFRAFHSHVNLSGPPWVNACMDTDIQSRQPWLHVMHGGSSAAQLTWRKHTQVCFHSRSRTDCRISYARPVFQSHALLWVDIQTSDIDARRHFVGFGCSLMYFGTLKPTSDNWDCFLGIFLETWESP